jgi:hypothetical protein
MDVLYCLESDAGKGRSFNVGYRKTLGKSTFQACLGAGHRYFQKREQTKVDEFVKSNEQITS